MSFDEKIEMIKKAIESKTKLNMTYLKSNDTKSKRTILPKKVGKMEYHGSRCYHILRPLCTQRWEE